MSINVNYRDLPRDLVQALSVDYHKVTNNENNKVTETIQSQARNILLRRVSLGPVGTTELDPIA